MPIRAFAWFILATGSPAAAAEESLARHVLSRLTYGPRAEEVERVARLGVDAFIAEQLDPASLDDRDAEARLTRLDVTALSAGELARRYPQMKAGRATGGDAVMTGLDGMEEGGRRPRAILEQLAAAKLLRAVYSRRQLHEVMSDFWFNHFNVAWNKGGCKWLVPAFERDAIRPHALGNFRVLLEAVAHHPAMLVYLDNRLSSAPRPGATGKARGLNENYARELLELHTLGVDGGYAQEDVIAVARCFTGWTVGRRDGEPVFAFKKTWHDAEDKTILGRPIRGRRSVAEGEAVLDLLACHPATARFIATKLCRRFIADDPPPPAVDAVAAAFADSGGDIRSTLRAVFATPEFRGPAARGAKVKTPFEFLASALRLLHAETDAPRQAIEALRRMGQMPYACEPPTGYPDTAGPWTGAGALLERFRVATALTKGKAPRTRVDLERAAGCPADGDADEVPERLWERLVGAPPGAEAALALAEAAGSRGRRAAPRYDRLVATILGSPDYQRR